MSIISKCLLLVQNERGEEFYKYSFYNYAYIYALLGNLLFKSDKMLILIDKFPTKIA